MRNSEVSGDRINKKRKYIFYRKQQRKDKFNKIYKINMLRL